MNIRLPKVLKYLFLCAVVAAAWNTFDHYRPKPIDPMTIERRASHRIEYEPQGGIPGRPSGWCTGTAIGPHAIMTASHCNEHARTDTIEIDQAVQKFHIQKTLTDGRDHDVYLVDATFTNFVPYKVRPAKMGERVYLYGSGHACYPPRRLDGIRLQYDDPSDIDADAGEVHFSMPVIPGDSGSAVYNSDGTIAAVTTYLLDDDWMWGFLSDNTTLDFVPTFTPDQMKEAEGFQPTAYVPPAPTEESKRTRPFNPFFFFAQ